MGSLADILIIFLRFMYFILYTYFLVLHFAFHVFYSLHFMYFTFYTYFAFLHFALHVFYILHCIFCVSYIKKKGVKYRRAP